MIQSSFQMIILPAIQIIDELRSKLEPRAIDEPSDENFACPQDTWLDEFGPYCAVKHPPYEPEKCDCDDIVNWALDQARISLGKSDAKNCGYALWRTEIFLPEEGLNSIFPKDGYRTHTTLLVRSSKGWRFFEPQNGLYCDAVALVDGFDALDMVIVRVRL